MKTLDVLSLWEDREIPWFHLFELNIDRQTAAQWFGTPAHEAWVDGLGDADFWAIEFDCGLKVGFEFLHCGYPASVSANVPVPQHVQRHLRHWQKELQEYPPEMFELDRAFMIERYAARIPELTELHSYQLWRQGDDGNQVIVGGPTSKQDALCWQAELESHKHKQIYWVSRVVETTLES